MSLTVALSKGRLAQSAEALFRRARLPFPEGNGRLLVVPLDGLRFLFVKDRDVPVYVEHGVADCGIAGIDVLRENPGDVYEPLDLGFGLCRLAVARLAGSGFDPARAGSIRVATKYPRIASRYFLEHGISAEIVTLSGSVELAPGLGLADCIVDVVETGRTLEENGLEVVSEIVSSSARLVVNPASFHARSEEVQRLIEALRGAIEK